MKPLSWEYYTISWKDFLTFNVSVYDVHKDEDFLVKIEVFDWEKSYEDGDYRLSGKWENVDEDAFIDLQLDKKTITLPWYGAEPPLDDAVKVYREHSGKSEEKKK